MNAPSREREKGFQVPVLSCLGTAKRWLDSTHTFEKTPLDFRRDDYFRTYEEECYLETNGELNQRSFRGKI